MADAVDDKKDNHDSDDEGVLEASDEPFSHIPNVSCLESATYYSHLSQTCLFVTQKKLIQDDCSFHHHSKLEL